MRSFTQKLDLVSNILSMILDLPDRPYHCKNNEEKISRGRRSEGSRCAELTVIRGSSAIVKEVFV